MQEWHGAVKMSSGRTGTGTRQNEEPQNDEKTGKDCGKVRNATMIYATKG
jgi:hypothetical protein